MATLQDFKNLQDSVSSSDQAEIAELYLTDRDAAVSKMIGIAFDKGVTLTSEEVQSFIIQLDEDDEFEDIELTAAALSSISGGGRGGKEEEAENLYCIYWVPLKKKQCGSSEGGFVLYCQPLKLVDN